MSALLDSFATAFDSLAARDAAGLGDSRKAALDAALRDGIPQPACEAWKYTPLRSLERRSVRRRRRRGAGIRCRAARRHPVAAHRLRQRPLRRRPQRPRRTCRHGVTLQPLSQVLRAGEPREANFLARRFERADEIFARLNSALADDGVVLRAAGRRAASTQPLHLVFIGAASDGDRAWHLRHLIELREGATLTVVEHHLGSRRAQPPGQRA